MLTFMQYSLRGALVGALLFVCSSAPWANEATKPTDAAVSPSEAAKGEAPRADTPKIEIPKADANKTDEPTDFLSRYRVGPGDVISIRLFGEDDLNKEKIRLTDVGTVPYPVLGEIRVLGMRPVEIEKFIEDGLRGRYLKNPRVSVTVDEYRPYFVTGEIGKAGSYPYTPGITVIKAITIAGGFKDRASKSKIFVAKESNPKEKRKVEFNTALEPGDILTIEESFF